MIIEMPPCQRRTVNITATREPRAIKRRCERIIFHSTAHRDREPGPLDRNIADRKHDRHARSAPGHSAAADAADPPSPTREFIVSPMNEVFVRFPLTRTH
jgi:predicted phage gp36 major capsid-like protein